MTVPHQFVRGQERKKVYYNTLVKELGTFLGRLSSLSKAEGCSISHLSPKSPQSPGARQDAPVVPYKYVYVYIDFEGKEKGKGENKTLFLNPSLGPEIGGGRERIFTFLKLLFF